MICLSAETVEEYSELKEILSTLNLKYVTYKASTSRGSLAKFFSAINFLLFLRRNKVSKIIGPPCLRNRAAQHLFSVSFGSYMRAIHPDPSLATSLSDKIYFRARALGLGWSFLNPYHATMHFVSSPLNRTFLTNRNIEESKIFEVGATWLHGFNCPVKISTTSYSKIIYVTQSFASHNNLLAHEEQVSAIAFFAGIARKHDYKFIIRKHPRDMFNYSGMDCSLGEIEVDSVPAANFIESMDGSEVVISSFSTLAFELMQIGISVFPLKLEAVPSFNDKFKSLGVSAISINAVSSDRDLLENTCCIKIFSKTDSSPIERFLASQVKYKFNND